MNAKEPITVRLADHLLVPTPLVLIHVPVTLGILGLERPAQAKTPFIFFACYFEWLISFFSFFFSFYLFFLSFSFASADINECQGTNSCATGGTSTCTNTVGSYTCACNAGYSGNGVTCTGEFFLFFLLFFFSWWLCFFVSECPLDGNRHQ